MLGIQPAIILVIICSLTYSFEIVFGLAGTIIMLPLLGFFFDSKTLVIYSLLPQMLVAGIALLKSFHKLNIKIMSVILIPAFAGSILGSYFFVNIPLEIFKYLLAAIIILSGVFMVATPTFTLSKPVCHILDFAAGLSHAMFSISGPIIMTRLLGSFADKTVIRNMALSFFLSMNVVRGVNYAIHDVMTPQLWQMVFISAPVLILVLVFADRLHFKLNDALFKRCVAWIIFFSGILYLGKQIYTDF